MPLEAPEDDVDDADVDDDDELEVETVVVVEESSSDADAWDEPLDGYDGETEDSAERESDDAGVEEEKVGESRGSGPAASDNDGEVGSVSSIGRLNNVLGSSLASMGSHASAKSMCGEWCGAGGAA